MKVALKYCGSCNPQIELGPLGRRLCELVSGSVKLVPAASGQADLLVILNGCPTACADRPEVRALAPAVIVVAGETVGLTTVREADISAQLAEMILGIAQTKPSIAQTKPSVA